MGFANRRVRNCSSVVADFHSGASGNSLSEKQLIYKNLDKASRTERPRKPRTSTARFSRKGSAMEVPCGRPTNYS